MTKTTRIFLILLCLTSALLFPKFAQDASAQLSIDRGLFAVGFACIGPVSVGMLFDNGMARCDPQGTANLFTNAVCTYENIINQILGKLFCGMQWGLYEPLSALMVLFVTIFGAAFLLGIIPFTAREMVLALFKFGLVWYFATEAELTIGYLYFGIMSFIQESVVVVMMHVSPTVATVSGPGGLFDRMDDIIAEFVRNAALSQDPENKCEAGLSAMFLTFIASVPMLAFIGVSMAIQFVMVFFQVILGYFIAITGIMFLITLAPIFLGFALFKFTSSYFNKWVQYLLSFGIQIFVVMAFIGIVISLEIGEDLRELFELARPYESPQFVEGTRVPIKDWCTICEPQPFGTFGITCANEEPLHPQALASNPEFTKTMATRLFKIMVLGYFLHKVLLAVPGVARALGAVPYAPNVGGHDPFSRGGGLVYPGSALAGSVGGGFSRGFRGASGNVAEKTTGGIRAGWNGLVGGRTSPP